MYVCIYIYMYEHVYTHYAWICMNMYLCKHVYVCVCMDYVSTIYARLNIYARQRGKGLAHFYLFVSCMLFRFLQISLFSYTYCSL